MSDGINNSWSDVRIGEVLTYLNQRVVLEDAAEYITITIKRRHAGLEERERLLGHEISTKKQFRLIPGAFIISRVQCWHEAYAIVPEIVPPNMIASVNYDQFAISPMIDRRFFWWLSHSPHFTETVRSSAFGVVIEKMVFDRDAWLQKKISIPPLKEQRRLVARIEELTGEINKALDLREEIKGGLNALLNATYRQIAEDMPRRPLGEIAPLNRRPVPVELDKSYPQVSVRSFGRGTFHKPPLIGNEVTWQKPFLVRAGDILVSNIKSWEGAIAVARPEDDGRVGSHRYLTFVPVPGAAVASFICFHLLTSQGLHDVGEASPGSADRNRTLNSKEFLKILVPVPEYRKQLWFDSVCREVETMKQLQTASTREFDALIPSILDKAFRGEL